MEPVDVTNFWDMYVDGLDFDNERARRAKRRVRDRFESTDFSSYAEEIYKLNADGLTMNEIWGRWPSPNVTILIILFINIWILGKWVSLQNDVEGNVPFLH